MRIDHASPACATVDSTRVLWLIRLLADFYQIVQTIKESGFVVSVDRLLYQIRHSHVWSESLLFHWIFRADKRLWSENRSKIALIDFVVDSILSWTWSILDSYDRSVSWRAHSVSWTTARVFIARSISLLSTTLCRKFRSCIRSRRDFSKRMSRNEVHHSLSFVIRLLQTRNSKNRSLYRSAFWDRNVSVLMFR